MTSFDLNINEVDGHNIYEMKKYVSIPRYIQVNIPINYK